jgi:hypothetical protein
MVAKRDTRVFLPEAVGTERGHSTELIKSLLFFYTLELFREYSTVYRERTPDSNLPLKASPGSGQPLFF